MTTENCVQQFQTRLVEAPASRIGLSRLAIVLRNNFVRAGAAGIVCLALLGLAAPFLTRWQLLHEPIQQDSSGLDGDGMPRPPCRQYWLGTDNLGWDVFARVIYGARVSLTVGVGAMLTATVIGVTAGLLAGFYGGKVDLVLMRFTDLNLSLPAILLAIAFAGLMDGTVVHLHPGWLDWKALDVRLQRGLVSVFLIIGFVSWPGMVRVVRAQVLSLKERDYVQAARALGASNLRILVHHILPNVLPTVIVLGAMNTANTILLEAGLGYLGIGVPPPAPTWGSIIAAGQAYFVLAPAIVIAPGVAILVTVLSFNLLGQGMQEVLKPSR